ncbi:MAG TPA: threonine synthase [Candidatus Thorarchaeota archaeon]|nr:MAG: threonine synthase [Candidatus Thorarchaeota archaeon]HDD67352.1 threonine synthase [Candidatus Thorarchaeota archaeon]
MFSAIDHLECPRCGKKYSCEATASVCVCGSPLLARYDLKIVEEAAQMDLFPTRINSMWRYSLLLPLKSPSYVFSLGEGWTPLLEAPRLGADVGLRMLHVKDETRNPTGSFKDRGLSVAVSKHVELGCKKFAMPTAGNAGVSMSAYCARAGAKARVFMPTDTPRPFFDACAYYGAEVTSVDGTISDCHSRMVEECAGWTDLSTTREPFRVEGKKTIGFEIVEQLDWEIPDVIVCPTGGGTALIGIWKAMRELRAMRLIGKRLPRLFAVQSEHCAPVVRAVERGDHAVESWDNPRTTALGLRVPKPFAGELILYAIRETDGGAVAVAESEIRAAQLSAARLEGFDMGPEAAVGHAGVKYLIDGGQVDPDEEVVVLNTGSCAKYLYQT